MQEVGPRLSSGGKQHLRDSFIETLSEEPSHLVTLDPEPLRAALTYKGVCVLG